MTDQRAILIAGPTASGKSALALRLAEESGGTVINADSMQVYRELRILTARPSAQDEACVPHLLYGHVAGSEAYSAGRYAREAAAAIAQARAMGRRPIVVGGTGLYFRALLDGLSPIPEIPDEIRERWRGEAQRVSSADLHKQLAGRDAEMARRLPSADRQRITRALEVIDATGRSLAEWQAQPGSPSLAEADCVRLVAAPDRDALYERCNARFDRMIAEGALDEVRALGRLKFDPGLPVMRALGVAPLMQLYAREIDRETAATLAKNETRQFAKRQLTWLRRNMCSWKHIETKEMESIRALDL